jgi:hypothetical protein
VLPVIEAAAKIPCWLPSREAIARVAHHHGYPTENAQLRIVRYVRARRITRGRTAEGWLVSLFPAGWREGADLDAANLELDELELIEASLLPAPGESEGPVERAWQPADRAVAYLITGYLVEWADWTPEMTREMERGEIKLGDLCRHGLPTEGQKSLQAPRELIPRAHFRPEMVTMKAFPANPLHLPKVVVRVDGTVGVSPRHRQQDYMGPPWCLIEVDWARLKPAHSPTEPPRGPLPSAEWTLAVTRKLQGGDKLKGVTRKSELARLLAAKSEEAAKAGEIRRQLKASYLENVLIDWGCWPLSSLE